MSGISGLVGLPNNPKLPFFAYGIFQKNEIAWPRIKDWVESDDNGALSGWELKLRNGLPILVASSRAKWEGTVAVFSQPERAYWVIGMSEPSGEYRWEEAILDSGIPCNVLAGRHPSKGVSPDVPEKWTSAQDPTFVYGMSYVASVVTNVRHSLTDIKPFDRRQDWDDFFQLQGAYLTLWTIVERYCQFRFGAEFDPSWSDETTFNPERPRTKSTTAKIYALAQIPEFLDAFGSATFNEPQFFSVRENKHNKRRLTDPFPKQCENILRDWYQARSNITHRGKSAHSDNRRILDAAIGVYNVFYLFLKATIYGIENEWRKLGLETLEPLRMT